MTAGAVDNALGSLQQNNPSLREDPLLSYRTAPEFADAERAHDRLQRAGARCPVLSNGTSVMLGAAIKAAGLQKHSSAMLSLDTLRVFKPDDRVYQLVVDEAGKPVGIIVYISVNGRDAYGVSAYGVRWIWCN